MKTPKLEVIPMDSNNKEDKKKAKLMSKLINYEYKKHKDFVDALTRARLIIENAYGIKTIDKPWELILQTYLQEKLKEK